MWFLYCLFFYSRFSSSLFILNAFEGKRCLTLFLYNEITINPFLKSLFLPLPIQARLLHFFSSLLLLLLSSQWVYMVQVVFILSLIPTYITFNFILLFGIIVFIKRLLVMFWEFLLLCEYKCDFIHLLPYFLNIIFAIWAFVNGEF